MGCTSSAQNIAESQPSTTDTLDANLKSEDTKEHTRGIDNAYSSGHSELGQKQVLPECKTSNNRTQLARNNSTPSVPDKTDSDMDINDTQRISPIGINDNTIEVTESTKLDDNLVTLKDVVEKIISDITNEDDEIIKTVEETTQNADVDRKIEDIVIESNSGDGVSEMELDENVDDIKESTSPSQSEDSRATRWEALADIAAELPPSLAVDPLTGQIYSLAK